ncbi:MAG: 7-cyano-7-deazaguanine synthase QueC [Actinobacteria bacterium]|nr:7-cyano-7-deazaguanine synthase QueC [Actinomycetota bacterium]
MERAERVVVSLSGGLDSTVLLHLMVRRFGADNVDAISFNYNQRHAVELHQAKRTTELLGVRHKIIDISFLGKMASSVSAMVMGDVATPTMEDVLGDPQPTTYMPNRNMILASLTAAYAETVEANTIALGIQRIDSYSYWDTTPEFFESIENVLMLNRKNPIAFIAPFLEMSKTEEILLGVELGVDFGMTWTCYDPQTEAAESTWEREEAGGRNEIKHYRYIPCGKCPSCKERAAAFTKAGVVDPLVTSGVVV